MDITHESRALLEGSGYSTTLLSGNSSSFAFEDANLFGGAFLYDDLASLLANWEPQQDKFLAEFAGRLRVVPDKLWNVYTLHFTAEICDSSQSTALFNVEEDFRGTRKIARAGLRTRDDVREALLPLLPIQNLVDMGVQETNELVRERLVAVHPTLGSLLSSISPAELAARLMERT